MVDNDFIDNWLHKIDHRVKRNKRVSTPDSLYDRLMHEQKIVIVTFSLGRVAHSATRLVSRVAMHKTKLHKDTQKLFVIIKLLKIVTVQN